MAQSSYGFRIGANIARLDGTFRSSADPEPLLGLVAGSYVDYELRNEFGIQLEVLYSSKGVTLPALQTPDSESALQATYLEVPLLLTYDLALGTSTVASFHVGPALAFEISERLFDRVDGFEQSQSSSSLKSPDIGAAVGVDLHLNLFSLDMLVGTRYTHGLRELAQSEGSDSASAKSRVLSFTVGFLL